MSNIRSKISMVASKPAHVEHPILEAIANRWSPVVYANTPVEKEKVMTCLEAARWAPSSYNEQPWRFVIGYHGDETFEKLADCLVDGNAWAKDAPVLLLSIAKKTFTKGDKPNRHAIHDVGAASGYFALQAAALDLATRQMAGFHQDKAIELFSIGEDFEPVAMMAIGYQGDVNTAPEGLKARDEASRERKPIPELLWEKS